jgi:ribosomal protein S18 acetylase RimI-like enzyme
MNMDVVTVCAIDATDFSLQSVYDLIQRSYAKRKSESNVEFNLLHTPFTTFADRINENDYEVLVAFVKKQLLGTKTMRIHESKGRRCAEGMWLAVAPEAQGMGVGSKLMDYGSEWARDNECDYIWEDTAVRATSSVKMHEKNGYYIYGLDSYLSTDYYSYVFRKQLKPSLWRYKIVCHTRFFFSFLIIHATKKRSGELTALGRFIKRFI